MSWSGQEPHEAVQGVVFGWVDGEFPGEFHADPVGHVVAGGVGGRGHPGGRVLVGLLPVGAGGDGDQVAGVVEEVGVGDAAGLGPSRSAGVPAFGERHEVVDIEGAGLVDGGVVVPGVPGAAGQDASAGHGRRGDSFVQKDLCPGIAAVFVGVDPAAEGRLPVVAGAVLSGDREGGDRLVEGHGALTAGLIGGAGGDGGGGECEGQQQGGAYCPQRAGKVHEGGVSCQNGSACTKLPEFTQLAALGAARPPAIG